MPLLACTGASGDAAGAQSTTATEATTQPSTPSTAGPSSGADPTGEVDEPETSDPGGTSSVGDPPSGGQEDSTTGERCDPPVAGPMDDPCTAALGPGSDRDCAFDFGGTSRNFLLYAPESFDACSPVPLIIDAHGASETAEQQAGLSTFPGYPGGIGSGWRLVADHEGFLVATPQGIGNVWDVSDVELIMEVVAMVQQVALIDPEQIYITGISNGGMLSYWAGCSQTEILRGLAPVAGALTIACGELAQPTPLIAFHAVGDSLVGYNSGLAAAQAWADANHCAAGPSPSTTYGGPTADATPVCLVDRGGEYSLTACSTDVPATNCESWDGCDEGVEVAFCTVAAGSQPLGGHILYFNDTRLSLAAVAWDFLKKAD